MDNILLKLKEIFTISSKFISEKSQFIDSAFDLKAHPFAILDILIVAFLFYWFYVLLKGTRGLRILVGIFILAFVMMISRIFELSTLNWVVRQSLTMLLVAIPIVFQPELRRALEKIGRPKFLNHLKDINKITISEIIEASKVMSRNKIGSLIVIKRNTGLDEYIDTGNSIDAEVSSKLILNLFFPNSPLHDGAVIIQGNKIAAAGCTLPLKDEEIGFGLGTRHKAALGLSAESDAIIIVISEQRGDISLVYDGKMIRRISLAKLEANLNKLLKPKNLKDKKSNSFWE